jgi:hypothetical protein
MHSYELAGGVINFLCESNGVLIHINFFDVASTSTDATDEFANVPPTTIGQFFPISEFAFV